jgi:hypothetical protein
MNRIRVTYEHESCTPAYGVYDNVYGMRINVADSTGYPKLRKLQRQTSTVNWGVRIPSAGRPAPFVCFRPRCSGLGYAVSKLLYHLEFQDFPARTEFDRLLGSVAAVVNTRLPPMPASLGSSASFHCSSTSGSATHCGGSVCTGGLWAPPGGPTLAGAHAAAPPAVPPGGAPPAPPHAT